jgi:Lrp/AsnC family leucine-responsive transcriptional regulator
MPAGAAGTFSSQSSRDASSRPARAVRDGAGFGVAGVSWLMSPSFCRCAQPLARDAAHEWTIFGMPELPDLDRIDLKLLKILQADGRISNLKLAETVALSPTAVLARVQRLTREGFIQGYEARLDPHRLGCGFTVFVEVLLDRTTPNVFDQFKAAVQVRDEIMECHMVAGGFDYLLKMRMADMAAYREFAGTVLWQLPGVRETRTYAVMEEVKSSARLPLKA